ncbi:MAG TPA: hypothetical protein VMT43_01785 [Acidimicrobiales bacterium]|nr:hypothetical protein [Acidimicrobiales bacterium]
MRLDTTRARSFASTVLAAAVWGGCGDGPRIEARPQTIRFAAAPTPAVNQLRATVTATASSGLPVRYASFTSSVCSVDAQSGLVTAAAPGTCTIAASQPGDRHFDAALTVTQDLVFELEAEVAFAPAAALAVYDQETVTAVGTAGLDVGYATTTPSVCAVDATTGLVVAISPGDCLVVATAGGAQASQTIVVAPPAEVTTPGAPSGVAATAGDAPGTVVVRLGAVEAGGSPITGYAVASSPPGVTAASASSPVTVTCPASCAGYRFAMTVSSAAGTSPPSAAADVITRYAVVATFREPDTQPNDSIFVGTFVLDASAGVVSGLRGALSESMTGGSTPYPDDTMTWVSLEYQLSSVPVVLDGAQGWLVTTFAQDSTNTLEQNPKLGGTDGWEPGSGTGLYYDYPGANPGNSYARIFVDGTDQTGPVTQAQIDMLAYADCAPGGMMGASCMTGTSVAGYGTVGTMGGYPVSLMVTKR